MAKRRTLTSEVKFGKIRKQIVDSFKGQLRGLKGCEGGCLNGSGRDGVCFYGQSFQASSPPPLDGVNELPGCHPRGPAQSTWAGSPTLDVFTTSISQAKALNMYIVVSADSASKSPQLESKREGAWERKREGERASCFAVDDSAWDRHSRRSVRLPPNNVPLPPCPGRFHKATEHRYSSLTGAELTPKVDTMLRCSGKSLEHTSASL